MPLVAIGQIEDSVPGLFRFLINSLVVGFEQKGWRAAAKRTSPIDISRHATSSYWSFSGDLSWAKHVVDRCSSQFLPMHFPPFFVFPIFHFAPYALLYLVLRRILYSRLDAWLGLLQVTG